MHSVPKEYANVRRFYVTKYGESKGIDMFEAYMRRRGTSNKSTKTKKVVSTTIIPWIPMRTVYRKTITRRRGANLVIKSRVSN
jgi:hypothetical protein